jgi:hypothetical protein
VYNHAYSSAEEIHLSSSEFVDAHPLSISVFPFHTSQR